MTVHKLVSYGLYGNASRDTEDGGIESYGIEFAWMQHDEKVIVELGDIKLSAGQIVDLAKSAVELQGLLIEDEADE